MYTLYTRQLQRQIIETCHEIQNYQSFFHYGFSPEKKKSFYFHFKSWDYDTSFNELHKCIMYQNQSVWLSPTVVWAHVIAFITNQISSTDGATDQKLFYDLECIYFCPLSKTVMQMKHLPSVKFKILFITVSTNQTT